MFDANWFKFKEGAPRGQIIHFPNDTNERIKLQRNRNREIRSFVNANIDIFFNLNKVRNGDHLQLIHPTIRESYDLRFCNGVVITASAYQKAVLRGRVVHASEPVIEPMLNPFTYDDEPNCSDRAS